ncbi:Asp-tRNA(Asn)/Glu-tRNA(Gln) amidotransferase subunit GatA [Solirubrobacter ginsenosidimutans]|uniref:Glutamyl-tRNA(Gln) amidotransferase subunit A n=1 Tax=Solirubrobacter ginsenosidimutans TaxID=490573 RepID=A0A9X3MY63_9ACTN|nr:Asp-tRNA(Asn)/Glu-tRNA(Gln) amidotransferase subunit GatA [Solirubrobacter ginsenosidimutans]MDA0163796.1 Asp-tRNA(Asn)/Glu-tRNA(Gln) amidotransferase subunit GatA [Solirubrobacter ginsenosidimutans]
MSMLELTAAQAAAAIKSGELDAAEYFAFYRDRAEKDAFNSFTWVAEETPEQDTDSAFAGVPIAIKDLFATEGIPSQAGSKILEGYRPPYTATSVRNLKAAGGTLLGKTNQDEFAMGSSTENSAYGPTLNPWDTTRVPGGSSGGSAASVAAGTAPWSIGTDTGGSIRQPAALCGIVGLKPTYGAISRYGMIAFASSLDQAGTFTRDVTDTALLLSGMVGPDPCDSTSIGLPEPVKLPTARDLKGIRLGVPEELSGEGIEPGVLAAFNDTLDKARALGATVETMHLPHAPHGLAAYYLLAPAEASSNLARYDGVRFGFRAKDTTGGLLGMYTKTREEGFGAEVKRRIMLGTYALSSGYYDAYYAKAQKVRTLIARDFTNAWENFDFVVTPTAPGVAFELGAKTADPLAMYLNDFCTVPMSLAGIPGISIPNGLSDGLPVGFQIAGPAFSENRLLDAAYALEQAIGFDGSGAFA